MTDTITLPREVVEKAVKAFENGCPPTCEKGMVDSGGFHPWGEPALVPCPACLAFEHLRTALAAEQPKPARLHATTTGVLLGSAWLVWNTPKGANDEIMSQETADLLNRIFADAEALRRDAERYRWLRENAAGFSGETLDAAIDAAMGDKR